MNHIDDQLAWNHNPMDALVAHILLVTNSCLLEEMRVNSHLVLET